MQFSDDEARREKFGLTQRELEIVSAVVAGYSNKEVAEYLKITGNTIKFHLVKIFKKLGVASRLQLALLWLGGPEDGEMKQESRQRNQRARTQTKWIRC